MYPTLFLEGQPGLTEVQEGFTSITGSLTSVLIPAIIGLAVIGVVVALGIKYLRKGAAKA